MISARKAKQLDATTIFTYSHANTPLGQSERAFYLSYFIKCPITLSYRVFSHDVTAAILVSQNNEMVTMLVSQTNPVGVGLFSYAKTFFCSNKFA